MFKYVHNKNDEYEALYKYDQVKLRPIKNINSKLRFKKVLEYLSIVVPRPR
ncbi:hypothetical protein HYE44_03100 [Mycoplasmopsis bovis]|nr:hypothetical protein [Mycoplasmopsis bovis]QQH20034.1 hypothetical protein HYE44_03100 [Mycoplasmopsis bovis]